MDLIIIITFTLPIIMSLQVDIFCFLTSKILPDCVIIIISKAVTFIFVIITVLLSLLGCYELLCFVLVCVCVLLSLVLTL
jgi:hypothetical protein